MTFPRPSTAVYPSSGPGVYGLCHHREKPGHPLNSRTSLEFSVERAQPSPGTATNRAEPGGHGFVERTSCRDILACGAVLAGPVRFATSEARLWKPGVCAMELTNFRDMYIAE